MPIRFKCTHCQKALMVKDHLGGKRVGCPACKKPVVVPAAMAPAEVEAIAAAALAEEDNKKKEIEEKQKPVKAAGTIDFICPFCDAQLKLSTELAGKKEPCPECKRIIRVPNPKEDKPKDWRTAQQAAGPSVAQMTQKQPELEGQWGTTTSRGRVSAESLVEAGAIADENDDAEPVGVFGWIRRVAIVALLGGIIYGAVVLVNQQQRQSEQKDSLTHALELIEGKSELKLSPEVTAEVFRGAGEIHARKSQAVKARTFFRKALAQFPTDPAKVSPDDDLCLIELALAQVELGGNEKDAIAGERIEWKDLEKDLGTTLGRIRSDEARVMGLRAVASRLLKQGQGPLAVGLANKLNPAVGGKADGSLIQSQWVAIVLAQGKAELVAKQVPAPDPTGEIVDVIARCGYAEGKARKGDLDAALKIAEAPGAAEGRLFAAVGVADLLQDSPGEASKAVPFIGAAGKVINEEMKGNPVPPWPRYQLARAYARAGNLENASELLKPRVGEDKRWSELKNWAQLEIVRGRLAKLAEAAGASLPEEVKDKDSPARALAFEACARHNTRLGYQADVRDELEKNQDPRIKALLLLGMALGN